MFLLRSHLGLGYCSTQGQTSAFLPQIFDMDESLIESFADVMDFLKSVLNK